VFEKINYCVCCDSDINLKIINISNDIKYLKNPENYVPVCDIHYKMYLRWYYRFSKSWNIIIEKEDKLINKKMHISKRLLNIFR